jgi:hypothetical protein
VNKIVIIGSLASNKKGIPIESRGAEQSSLRHCSLVPYILARTMGIARPGCCGNRQVTPTSEFRELFSRRDGIKFLRAP